MASLGLDNFHVESDNDSDDPFASPPRESLAKKRKEPDSGLGIDQEVSIQKRARVPNVKLDEERLLGPLGIPKLKARAATLKLKGKGHEFSDAARLLSLYQLWLDDLFPKARFLDALAMVEKAGHKKKLQVARQEWIGQGRPKAAEEEDDAAVDVVARSSRDRTPVRDRAAHDDLYGATPRARRAAAAVSHAKDDVNDLEALMAEAELLAGQAPGEDGDLEALMAETEEQDRGRTEGGGVAADVSGREHDYADDEAAMQEMEGLW